MMNLGALLATLQAFALAPRAMSFLVPSPLSPTWSGQHESCGVIISTRPSECGGTMNPSAPDTYRRPLTASACSGGPWGAGAKYLAAWVAGATSVSRSAFHAHAPSGTGGWWVGNIWGGGGNNGTGTGAPSGDAMGDGGGGRGEVEINGCCVGGEGRRPAGFGSVPRNSPAFGPWALLSALWALYAVWLRESPILTKALTAGVLALSGDIVAQCFEFQRKGRQEPFLRDTRRLLAVAIDSAVITGPALHALYGVMERLIPTTGGGVFPAVAHLAIDTFVLDPMFVTSFFCVTGVLENRRLKTDVLPALRREFWPAVRGSWVVSLCFCPLQFVTFRYLPLELRVLSVNVCDIVWTSVLSYFSHKAPAVVNGDDHGARVVSGRPRDNQREKR